eukprot:SAG22_NODE_14833_length_363_cov_105.844697_1_plen_22_part_10
MRREWWMPIIALVPAAIRVPSQ